jgi:subtilisin family serine protease
MRGNLRDLRRNTHDGANRSGRHSCRVEPLEAIVLPSAAPWTEDYEAWRQQTFTIDHAAFESVIDASALGDVEAMTSQARSQIGVTQAVQQFGYTGTGYAVAVLDTGVDYRHASLASNYAGGWDFVDDDGDPMDLEGHGTHVAGTIASTNATHPGIAPGARIIALRVLDANGSGSYGDVEAALQWVVRNRAQYNIVAVNMSLGSGNFASNPYTFLEDELAALESQGVFTAAAAGNSFYTLGSQLGLGYPAISPRVVSVGAVWDGSFGRVTWASGAIDYTTGVDRVTSFSQRSADLGILAPGAFVTSTYLDGQFVTMAGTSMATPVAAGAAVLIRQAIDARGLSHLANQDAILSIMRNTGQLVVDGDDENDNVVNSGLSFRRVNVLSALQSLGSTGGGTGGGGGGGGSSEYGAGVGVYSTGQGVFRLRYSASAGPADVEFQYGPGGTGWRPVIGDWNNDGVDTVGLYHSATGTFHLRNENSTGAANIVFNYGPAQSSWLPIAGDWNGDGRDTIGLYDPQSSVFYLRNDNSTGMAHLQIQYGPAGANWVPLAADWNNDGTDTIGLYQASAGLFHLRNSNQSGVADVTLVYGPAAAGWNPVVGDWNDDGRDTVGLEVPASGMFYLRNSNTTGVADVQFGMPDVGLGWIALAGRWRTGVGGASAAGTSADPTPAALLAGLWALDAPAGRPTLAGTDDHEQVPPGDPVSLLKLVLSGELDDDALHAAFDESWIADHQAVRAADSSHAQRESAGEPLDRALDGLLDDWLSP